MSLIKERAKRQIKSKKISPQQFLAAEEKLMAEGNFDEYLDTLDAYYQQESGGKGRLPAGGGSMRQRFQIED